MDGLIAYAMLDKKLKSVVSGYDHAAQTGDTTFSIFFTDGSKIDLNIPKPLDGKDGADGEQGERGLGISNAYFNTDDKLVIVLEDGTELDPLTLPLAKVEVSKEAGNAITQKADGIFAPAPDLTNYVEKETGKGLSTNDYTNADKAEVEKVKDKVDKVDGKSLVNDTDITQIGTNKTAIETLNGADTVEGSVAKQVKDAIDGLEDVYVKQETGKGLSSNDYTDDEKAEVEKIAEKVDSDAIVTTFSDVPLDTNIPSEKLVHDSIEHFDERIDQLQLYKFPNATIHGEPTINNGQVSGFTATDYLAFPFLVDFKDRPFEINMAFTTGAEVNNQHNIIDGVFGLAFAVSASKFVLALSSDGETWDIGNFTGTHTITANTNYYVKLSWDGSTYKLSYSLDKEVWTDDITVSSSLSLYPIQMYIGVGEVGTANPKPFNGIINMNASNVFIDGNIIWQGMDDVGLATRLATDLDNIDELGKAEIKKIAETSKKVDKVPGKGLSTNDYTDEDKAEVGKVKDKADVSAVKKIYDDGFASNNLYYANVLTTTVRGVTSTNNGDGTFTISGTATGDGDLNSFNDFSTSDYIDIDKYDKLKVIFSDTPNSNLNFICDVRDANGEYLGQPYNTFTDCIFNVADVKATYPTAKYMNLLWVVFKGATVNEVVKPFVTTNLDATIDDFHAYGESNVELTAEIKRKNIELVELKMLGWNVPKECPLQNDVVGNQFIQKVGRVALDNLVWNQNVDDIHAYYAQMPSDVKADKARRTKGYCIGYEVKYNGEPWEASWDKIISIFEGGTCEFYNKSCDTLDAFRDTIRGKYFYYELGTQIETPIDGNEILVTRNYLSDVLMSENTSVRDLNEYRGQEGKQHYYVYANSLCANIPINNGDDFQVEIISKYMNSCIQIAYTLDNSGRDTVGNIYTRSAQMSRETLEWTWTDWKKLNTSKEIQSTVMNVTEGGDYNITDIVGVPVSDVISMVGFGNTSVYDFCIIDAKTTQFAIRILKGSGDVRINYRLA